MVKEKKSHFTARIPEYLIDKINTEAKTRNTTVTAIVEEAFKSYFSENLPGLCPSCHTQNDPDAQYCQSCGTVLTEVSSDPETIPPNLKGWVTKQQTKQEALEKKIQEMDLEMRKVIRMTKIIEKYKEEHDGKLE